LARLFVQTVYFVILARMLPVEDFGGYVAALAIVNVVLPFAAWGTGNLLVMRVTRDPTSFPLYWGNTLLATLVTCPLFAFLILLFGITFLQNVPMELLFFLAIAELLMARVAEASAQAFQAFEETRLAWSLAILPYAFRVVPLVVMFALDFRATVTTWALWYLVMTTAAAAVAATVTTRRLGKPRPNPRQLLRDLRIGFHFSVSQSAASIQADMDKTLLAQLGTLQATGIYAAGYRVINMSLFPVRALLYAAYARFFRHGERGIEGSLGFAKRILPYSCACGLVASVGVFLTAPVVPLVLGESYRESVEVIRLLAALPLLQSIHVFAADTLTGAGFQAIRSAVQIAVVLLNVLLNVWLIPLYSWKGAAWATVISDGVLTLLLWITVWLISSRAMRANAHLREGVTPP